MSKPPRLHRTRTLDLPVAEASGLAARADGDGLTVVVVGDRTAHVGIGTVSEAGEVGGWRVVDLSELDGWNLPATDSQLEAVALDGADVVALLREDPPVVIVADTGRRRVVARVTLTVPPDLDLDWQDPSSRGEGLVFLRGGRLLVAKEKHPPALVEFCPPGVPAHGIAATDLLGAGEPWSAPEGDVEFVARAAWPLTRRARKRCRDISDIGVGRDGALWLLSDRSATLARLSLERPLGPTGRPIRELDQVWRLPKGTTKPEGAVALGGGRALIALDTKQARDNGLVVEPPG